MYPSFTYIRTDKFIGKGMYEIKKKKFPNDRLIPEKQGRERGNKYISNVGLTVSKTSGLRNCMKRERKTK